ncbi:hypothetical protein EDB81DRAFT_162012 [Dactylonectria macrodidyma]|uniref:Zn(2)-C6 fungal-type domain-containing protein n=1 Tax=Dactylonectria macrodidyma TaxID=307937 RepID=A0A9P9JLB8_9HYPO|nr:hypothetical protein EDB81DRAFT_162012 [Dactylonectria macrodidyma]
MSPDAAQLNNKGPKACTTCAKAKARCIAGPDGSLKCDRCHRLDKPCVSQTPAPPRARKSPKLSKIAALEKRLEELSSHVQEGPAWSPTPPKEEPLSELCTNSDKWNFSHLFPLKNGASNSKVEAPLPSTAPDTVPDKPQPWESLWPTPNEGEMLLEHYRSTHSDLFPFVIVPTTVTSVELRQSRPFVWKASMMVSCFLDGARQQKLGNDLLAEIGQAALVDGSKSLDLLQGLQMLVSWYHYALNGAQVTNLLFLARAMCVNLGFKEDASLQGAEHERNMDHMRAYACTYYLNTLVFTANKRPDVLMNTGLLETCCRGLEATMQYASDGYLVKLVRIQQLAQSISLTMAVDNISQHAMKLPLTMVVRAFQDQLDQFSASLSPQFSNNDVLNSHINVAEVLLYEIALSDQHSTASYVPLTDRLQLLWGCVRSLRSFFDIRFATRELERPRFLCLSASDFVFTIITALRLVTLQLPGWNLTQIQSELNIIDVMDKQICDLVIVISRRKQGIHLRAAAPPAARRDDPFDRLLRQLKTLRDLVKLELDRQNAGCEVPAIDFTQDFLIEGLESDVWPTMGSMEVWNVVGDPAVLDASLS